MIKIVSVLRRRPGMSVETFRDYWLNVHADLVCRMPGVRRYVQSHTIDGGYRRGEPAADGIAELWFDDTDALRALAGTSELEAVTADHAEFVAEGCAMQTLTQDRLIKDGPMPADGVKNVELVHRRPGMGVEAFQRYWTETHGPLGAAIPTVLRYVQSQTRPSAYRDGRDPAYDGFALTWFEGTDAMRASAATEAYERTRADEPNFIGEPLAFIITREHVLVGD